MNRQPRILLACEDGDLRRRLTAALTGVGECKVIDPQAGDLLQALVESKPALLLMAMTEATQLHRVVGLVRRADPATVVVCVGDACSAGLVLEAMRAGAADFLDWSAAPEVLRAQLVRQLESAPATGRASPGAFEVVLPARPGGGENLFAINMAVARGRDALLLDCALPVSEAAAALDVRLLYSVQDAIRDLGRFDRTFAQSALARHQETGLMVLPLATPAAPEVDEVGPEALARLVSVIRPLFKDTVLNLGGVRNPPLLREILQAATRIYLVCPQRFTAVAHGQRLLERIAPGREALERTVLVVDEYLPEVSLTEEQMRAALGLAQSVRLRDARAELLNSLNTGRPLVLEQPRSAYARTVAHLAGVEGRPTPAPAVRLLSGAVSAARARIAARGGR